MELRHIRAFHAVAEELSFRRAAERLGLAQPALSRTIRDLEDHLQVKLLERTTRIVGLTEAGRTFLTQTRGPLRDLADAVRLTRAVEQGIAGELRVGYNDYAINGLLPLIVRRFRAAWPDIRVSLIDETTPLMLGMVLNGRLDISFHQGPAEDPDLDSITAREERLICVLPSTHRLADEAAISVPDLAGEFFVMGTWETWKVFYRVVTAYCRQYGVELKVIQESVHSDGIVGLVAAGLGISLYVDSAWLHSVRGVVVRPLKQPPPPLETLATWRRDQAHKPALRRFIAVAKEIVAEEGVRFKP